MVYDKEVRAKKTVEKNMKLLKRNTDENEENYDDNLVKNRFFEFLYYLIHVNTMQKTEYLLRWLIT